MSYNYNLPNQSGANFKKPRKNGVELEQANKANQIADSKNGDKRDAVKVSATENNAQKGLDINDISTEIARGNFSNVKKLESLGYVLTIKPQKNGSCLVKLEKKEGEKHTVSIFLRQSEEEIKSLIDRELQAGNDAQEQSSQISEVVALLEKEEADEEETVSVVLSRSEGEINSSIDGELQAGDGVQEQSTQTAEVDAQQETPKKKVAEIEKELSDIANSILSHYLNDPGITMYGLSNLFASKIQTSVAELKLKYKNDQSDEHAEFREELDNACQQVRQDVRQIGFEDAYAKEQAEKEAAAKQAAAETALADALAEAEANGESRVSRGSLDDFEGTDDDVAASQCNCGGFDDDNEEPSNNDTEILNKLKTDIEYRKNYIKQYLDSKNKNYNDDAINTLVSESYVIGTINMPNATLDNVKAAIDTAFSSISQLYVTPEKVSLAEEAQERIINDIIASLDKNDLEYQCLSQSSRTILYGYMVKECARLSEDCSDESVVRAKLYSKVLVYMTLGNDLSSSDKKEVMEQAPQDVITILPEAKSFNIMSEFMKDINHVNGTNYSGSASLGFHELSKESQAEAKAKLLEFGMGAIKDRGGVTKQELYDKCCELMIYYNRRDSIDAAIDNYITTNHYSRFAGVYNTTTGESVQNVCKLYLSKLATIMKSYVLGDSLTQQQQGWLSELKQSFGLTQDDIDLDKYDSSFVQKLKAAGEKIIDKYADACKKIWQDAANAGSGIGLSESITAPGCSGSYAINWVNDKGGLDTYDNNNYLGGIMYVDNYAGKTTGGFVMTAGYEDIVHNFVSNPTYFFDVYSAGDSTWGAGPMFETKLMDMLGLDTGMGMNGYPDCDSISVVRGNQVSCLYNIGNWNKDENGEWVQRTGKNGDSKQHYYQPLYDETGHRVFTLVADDKHNYGSSVDAGANGPIEAEIDWDKYDVIEAHFGNFYLVVDKPKPGEKPFTADDIEYDSDGHLIWNKKIHQVVGAVYQDVTSQVENLAITYDYSQNSNGNNLYTYGQLFGHMYDLSDTPVIPMNLEDALNKAFFRYKKIQQGDIAGNGMGNDFYVERAYLKAFDTDGYSGKRGETDESKMYGDYVYNIDGSHQIEYLQFNKVKMYDETGKEVRITYPDGTSEPVYRYIPKVDDKGQFVFGDDPTMANEAIESYIKFFNNTVHHYEDADGNIVHPTYESGYAELNQPGVHPITYEEYYKQYKLLGQVCQWNPDNPEYRHDVKQPGTVPLPDGDGPNAGRELVGIKCNWTGDPLIKDGCYVPVFADELVTGMYVRSVDMSQVDVNAIAAGNYESLKPLPIGLDGAQVAKA